jgi:O-antigen/teichoic acid export membrane protein
MKQRFEPKSEFSRNILTLMTGTIIAQAIPIAISPILTRIYRPEDFGLYAIFVAIITILGSVASGRYELAIMLPKKDEDAINIFALGILITVGMTAFITILVVVLNDFIVSLLNNQEIGFWLYFIPVSVFFVGCFNLLNVFNNRCENYIDIKNSQILKSTTSVIVQLLVGLIKQGVTGLISGQILSQAIANMQLLKNII